jgi:hypothetical protein
MGPRLLEETMRKFVLAALVLGFFAGCSEGNKYSAMRPEYGGAVEFPTWPPLAKSVAGYNLYLAPKPDGPWEKINDTPITGGKMMVPYLQPGQDYYFRLTSVGKNGMESRPGGAFKRRAAQALASK